MAQLIVIGPRPEVIRFARDARPQVLASPKLRRIIGTVTREPMPRDVFDLDMMIGESNQLFTRRMKNLGHGICQKRYGFDVRNDDGRSHFRRISRRYPALDFVLVYCDPNLGEYGSYLIHDGRSRWYLVPDDVIESALLKQGYEFDDENADEDDNELAYMEASWDLMDQSEARWVNLVYKRLGVQRSPE